ncbi:hypothetical protein LWI28_028175 [Acer negundo]|uniref:Uncharacterized protein n=1 Tax=Acer negundo TaxID=4023 RepID=A0AAD5ISH6_ACENE|nr:hypothetical protein LWI28_028175 [Acer negundo]
MDLEEWTMEANGFVRIEGIRCWWLWRPSTTGVGGDGGHPLPVSVATHEQHQCIGAIVAKLPQTWNNYRKKLLHMVEDISLENFQKSIQIEEETRNHDKSVLSQDSSKVHVVEAGSKYKKNFKIDLLYQRGGDANFFSDRGD